MVIADPNPSSSSVTSRRPRPSEEGRELRLSSHFWRVEPGGQTYLVENWLPLTRISIAGMSPAPWRTARADAASPEGAHEVMRYHLFWAEDLAMFEGEFEDLARSSLADGRSCRATGRLRVTDLQ